VPGADYDPRDYPPFAVACDITIFAVVDGELSVLLVRRGEDPHVDRWVLPGGFVGPHESADDAAHRELVEETGLSTVWLEQLRTFSTPDRDPRMRVVSVAYVALVAFPHTPQAGTDAAEARYWKVAELPGGSLAFDHDQIVATALERVRSKLEYTTLATTLLGPEFTIGELRHVYEAVWQVDLDVSNFRRKVLATPDFVAEADDVEKKVAGPGRPAVVYRPAGASQLHPPILRGAVQG
jgi:8-oxo-dGTP diphosphatase